MKSLFINRKNPLILSSASPRRKQLLAQARLPFLSEASHVAETDYLPGPEETARILAEKKACEVFSRISSHWTLGADTLVVINGSASPYPVADPGNNEKILGKPRDRDDAVRMLGQLSGKTHRVITGFCILNPSGKTVHVEAVCTEVHIKKLTGREIEAYVNTKEPYGKAGSYAIQGIGSFMIETISGSYTNVVGLPLFHLIRALCSVGALESYPLPEPGEVGL